MNKPKVTKEKKLKDSLKKAKDSLKVLDKKQNALVKEKDRTFNKYTKLNVLVIAGVERTGRARIKVMEIEQAMQELEHKTAGEAQADKDASTVVKIRGSEKTPEVKKRVRRTKTQIEADRLKESKKVPVKKEGKKKGKLKKNKKSRLIIDGYRRNK